MASLVYEREIGIDDSNLSSNGGNLINLVSYASSQRVGWDRVL